MNQQRLYRSRNNKVFAGVCGGVAEYFDVDPVIIRIIFVLLFIFGGSGFLLYIAAIFIVPKRPYEPVEQQSSTTAAAAAAEPHSDKARNWFGAILVTVGVIILLANLEVFHFMWFLEDAFEYVFPVLLIILGMALIYYKQSRPEPFTPSVSEVASEGSSAAEPVTGPRTAPQFRRSSTDKKMFGVCGGLAQYFGVDSSILRMLYVVLCVASFGTGILLYIIIALVVPYDTADGRRRV